MKRLLLIVALASTALLSPAFADDKGADDRIFDQVRMRLAGDPDVKGGDLEVTVKDGAVTLKGKVSSDKARHRAEALSKKVKGVKSVDNELTVGTKMN
jgi:osmotically-inducible protein OsmY